MNNLFLTLGYDKFDPKVANNLATLVSLLVGLVILIELDAQTLFLAAALISIIAIKSINKYHENSDIEQPKNIVINKLIGMWFALSIAPSISVSSDALLVLSNGFLIQAIFSLMFFVFFSLTKFSIIGRIEREAKGGLSVIGGDIIAGFAAGISSALTWQAWLNIQGML